MSCPQEPIPYGWRVWRGPVPAELTAVAKDVVKHVNLYPYGQAAQTVVYQGTPVAAFKSHHTWTYRGGQLLTGLCIPGVSLLVPAGSSVGADALVTTLDTPDPELAVYDASRPGSSLVAPLLLALLGGATLVAAHAPR